jgi:hypothetical protein
MDEELTPAHEDEAEPTDAEVDPVAPGVWRAG